MKFSTADKDFYWLSGNIFRILYPKYISDPATGNADFLAQWSSCWNEFHIQNHKLCSCFTSVCLYLEKITFFRGCSSSVSWIFFFFFWLHCGSALDSLSVFYDFFSFLFSNLCKTSWHFPFELSRHVANRSRNEILPLPQPIQKRKGSTSSESERPNRVMWDDFSSAWCWWDTNVSLKEI